MSSPTAIVYHSVIPENNKALYGEFEVVDFICQFPNRKMNLNSVRLEGLVVPKSNTGDDLTDEICQMDKLVGAHCLFESIQTFVNGQSVDMINNYPRMVKMLTACSENQADMNNANNVCELKASCNEVAAELLRKEKIPAQHAVNVNREIDFSIKPMIAVNQCYSSRRALSSSQVSEVRFSITINRNNSILFGNDVVDGFTMQVRDLRLTFTSYPDDGITNEPILMKKRMMLKQSFESTTAQLNFNYPMEANKIYGSFLIQADENQPTKNNQALNKPANVERLSFFWNNSTNEYVSYQLRSDSEIIERAIDAVGDTGRNEASIANINNNNGYVIGLNLGEYIDMMNTKLSVVLESAQTAPMLLYMSCEGILTL